LIRFKQIMKVIRRESDAFAEGLDMDGINHASVPIYNKFKLDKYTCILRGKLMFFRRRNGKQ